MSIDEHQWASMYEHRWASMKTSMSIDEHRPATPACCELTEPTAGEPTRRFIGLNLTLHRARIHPSIKVL